MDTIDRILEKSIKGERITPEEGLAVCEGADLAALGKAAEAKRFQRVPERRVTYVVDRNINYTDICVSQCKFCAFYKTPESNQGYVLSKAKLYDKIEETISLGGTQILLQGGMNPDLGLDYYTDLLRFIKAGFDIHIHGFSPPEIVYISSKESVSVEKTLKSLRKAGLDSIPGGGAEILCDEVRKKVSPGKCGSEQWLNVMETAHHLGMKTSATMMFGHAEKPHHIFLHLEKLRKLQDRTGGFTAFIPWTFQPDNTKISMKKKSSAVYLRVLAASRLFLDNFDNVQASWVTQGDKIAQTALFFGANDMGSTMIEENVVASAGVDFMLPESELQRIIHKAGFDHAKRDCYYNLI